MSDWTEGRTWVRTMRGDTREEGGWLVIRREKGEASYFWEVSLVGSELRWCGYAKTLRRAKWAAEGAYTRETEAMRRARGGA